MVIDPKQVDFRVKILLGDRLLALEEILYPILLSFKIIFSATRLCDSDNESCSDLTTCGSRRRRDILRWGMTHENSNVYTMTSGPIKIVKNNWGLFLVYKTFEQKLKILDKPQWNRLEISPIYHIGENLAHNLSTSGFEHFQIRFPPFYLGFHNLQSSFCWMKNVNFLSAFPSFLLHLSICVLRSWSTEIKQRLNPLVHAFYWSFFKSDFLNIKFWFVFQL